MTFLSVPFLWFAFLVSILEGAADKKKYLFLSVVSIAFYSFGGWQLTALLLISSISDFYLSKFIVGRRDKLALVAAIAVNIIFLAGVKLYYYGIELDSVLPGFVPIGISFYSLQSISYLVDVWRGKTKRIESFLAYLAYISFFPQLVAGPIERCNKLYPQLKNFGLVGHGELVWAIKIFSFGAYLKLVVANNLSEAVNGVSSQSVYDFIFFANGLVGFIYVYADFFAYTLMARGVAAAFNIQLSLNFDRPFRRKTLIGFWQSWHISLTKWITDYFYIPIMRRSSGSRGKKIIFSVLSMILVGLWHGLSLNFIIFGFVHGLMMQALPLVDSFTARYRFVPRVNNRLGVVLTMMISGNIFLHGSHEQLIGFLDAVNYSFLSLSNLALYLDLQFFVGLVALAPLAIHEFGESNFLYGKYSADRDLAIAVSFLLLTALFFGPGEQHVYFAF